MNEINFFAEKLKEKRLERNLTQQELANLIGVKDSAITQYEKGKREPKMNTVFKLADALGVSIDYFVNNQFNKVVLEKTLNIAKIPIRIYGVASCGDGYNNDYEITDYLEIPSDWVKGNVFGCYSKGDSMIGAGIIEGSLVIAKEQNTLENNEIGVFHLNGEEYIKRFKNTGGVIILKSENVGFNDIEVNEDDKFYVIGKVTKIVTNIN